MTRLTLAAPCLAALWVFGLATLSAADDYEATREEFLEQINTARVAAGRTPLKLSAALSSVAQQRAGDIAAGRERSGRGAEEDLNRASKAGYEARVVSEISAEADGAVEDVVSGWKNETGPVAEDLLGRDYREIGVGVSLVAERPLYVLLFALSWEDFFRERTGALSDLERVRRDMLARVNRERESRGLSPLRRHPYLDDAAQAHANDMFVRRYYSHDSPNGNTAIDRVAARGYRARYAGENIARGQYSVDEVMDGWMKSPTHREHLLSPVFNDVGFGLRFGKNPGGYEILWVQNFARPRGRERL